MNEEFATPSYHQETTYGNGNNTDGVHDKECNKTHVHLPHDVPLLYRATAKPINRDITTMDDENTSPNQCHHNIADASPLFPPWQYQPINNSYRKSIEIKGRQRFSRLLQHLEDILRHHNNSETLCDVGLMNMVETQANDSMSLEVNIGTEDNHMDCFSSHTEEDDVNDRRVYSRDITSFTPSETLLELVYQHINSTSSPQHYVKFGDNSIGDSSDVEDPIVSVHQVLNDPCGIAFVRHLHLHHNIQLNSIRQVNPLLYLPSKLNNSCCDVRQWIDRNAMFSISGYYYPPSLSDTPPHSTTHQHYSSLIHALRTIGTEHAETKIEHLEKEALGGHQEEMNFCIEESNNVLRNVVSNESWRIWLWKASTADESKKRNKHDTNEIIESEMCFSPWVWL